MDQGFEMHFRQSCILRLNGWLISQPREMELGGELLTASGTRHEVDLIARHPETVAIVELKNRPSSPPTKGDVAVFFAKFLDYLAFNPKLLLTEVCPVFLSSGVFEEATLGTCIGLGIHPVAPGLRPVPLLAESLMRVGGEIARGLVPPQEIRDRWEDACARLNALALALEHTWVSARCGYVSDEAIHLRAAGCPESLDLGRALRQINGDCSAVVDAVRQQKAAG